MITTIRDFFRNSFDAGSEAEPADREYAVRLATATLLVEVARADFEESGQEQEAIHLLLQKHFVLSKAHTNALFEAATEHADTSVSLHEFTRVLHQHLSEAEKHQVIALLWRVALADSVLDKHEDHLVRKVAGLLYVSHRDLVRIKHQVREEHEGREPPSLDTAPDQA